MSSFSVVALVIGGAGMVVGCAGLVFRVRVFAFARNRFERIYREDGVPEHEIADRFPQMWFVILIATGWVIVSALMLVVGVVTL